MTRSTLLRIIKIASVSIAIGLIVAYASWRSLEFARGPHISIYEPSDWASIHATTTLIRGRVERAHKISLNGRPILIDEAGNFSEIVTVFPGMNIWTFEAEDRFDRKIAETIRVSR